MPSRRQWQSKYRKWMNEFTVEWSIGSGIILDILEEKLVLITVGSDGGDGDGDDDEMTNQWGTH